MAAAAANDPTRRGEARTAFLFILPAWLMFLIGTLLPVVAVVCFAFLYIDRLGGTVDFVGLENFRYVLGDPRFWRSFWNTLYFVVLGVSGNVGLGLLLALLLNRRMPAAVLYFFRLAYFLPVLISTAFVAIIWKFLYSTDLGIINYYVRALGFAPVGWLTDSRIAMISIAILDVWKNVGFFMLIFLAALQDVPREIIEAAQLDGAGRTTILFRIILPIIAPVIFFCVTIATMGGLQVFDPIRIMTNGGPGDATRSLALHMYGEAFEAQDVGAGSSVAIALLVLVAAVTAIQFFVGRRLVRV